MKTVGIIAEFNPFHNGHKYIIQKAKEITGADNVIVICSGNFVQRGEPSIFDKYTRSKIAINNGADAIFELPVVYSTASAELFAYSSVKLLEDLKVIDYLIFGCETADFSSLSNIAKTLADEPIEYKNTLLSLLKTGLAFPKARCIALDEYFKNNNILINAQDILGSPNNILAVEYLKALTELNSKIKPIPIKRVGNDYSSLKKDGTYVSATSIRNQLKTDKKISSELDSDLLNVYNNKNTIFLEDFQQLIAYKMLNQSADIYDVSNELANRIRKQLDNLTDINNFISNLQSKNYTYAALSRAVIHILLDIKESDMKKFFEEGYHFYARLLGFNPASNILKEIKNNSNLQIISKYSDFYNKAEGLTKRMLDICLNADNIYRQVYMLKYKKSIPNEFNSIIIKK